MNISQKLHSLGAHHVMDEGVRSLVHTCAYVQTVFLLFVVQCAVQEGGFFFFWVALQMRLRAFVSARARSRGTKDKSQSWQNAGKIGGERSRSGSEGLRFWGDNCRDVRDSVSFPV